MEAIFLKLINMSISASWLILAVIVLRQFLKKAPKWTTCLLWAIVAIRLVCPLSFESIFSLIPSAETISPAAVRHSAESAVPVVQSGVTVIDRTLNPLIQSSFAAKAENSATPLQIWTFTCSIVWAAGLAMFLGYALFGYVRIRIRVRESIPLRGNIRLCDAVHSPFILGIIRPRIYLFSGTEEAQMDYILAHEQSHLKRRDHWWKALGYLLLSVYWFNPLVWVSYFLLCRDIELACDEKVIKDLNMRHKKAYSDALVSCSMRSRRMLVCPLAFGEIGVKERVKKVLQYRKPAFRIIAVSVTACLVVAVCFLTNPPYRAEAENLPPAKSDSENVSPAGTDLEGNRAGTDSDENTPTTDSDLQPEETMDPQPAGIDYSGYDALIAEARDALINHAGECPEESERKFSLVFWYGETTWQTLGYLIRDLDGDGVDELIFGENDDDSSWNGYVYNIYTISDGEVVRLIDGWERSIYYFCENGCIAHEWSGSAFEGGENYYRYENGRFTLIESVVFDIGMNYENWFHSTEYDSGNWEEYQPITMEQAEEIRGKYVMERPQFTPFITQ